MSTTIKFRINGHDWAYCGESQDVVDMIETLVEELEAENKRLREALQRLIDTADGWVEPSAIDDARKAILCW